MRSALAGTFPWAVAATLLGASPEAHAGGAVVVSEPGLDPTVVRPLATRIYADAQMRPTVDDATAKLLLGYGASTLGMPEEHAAPLLELVRAAFQAEPSVEAHLFVALGRKLDADALVVVEDQRKDAPPKADPPGDEETPIPEEAGPGDGTGDTPGGSSEGPVAELTPPPKLRARVFLVEAGEFAPMVLEPGKDDTWQAAATISLLWSSPAPKPAPAPLAPTASDQGGFSADFHPMQLSLPPPTPVAVEDPMFYENPWFWAAVGVVGAVGATVLIASAATADDVSNVSLSGSVSP